MKVFANENIYQMTTYLTKWLNCILLWDIIKYFVLSKDDISHNKIASQSNTFPGLASDDASNAVDGNTATCMRANVIGPTSLDKTVWWKVDLGGVSSIYRINILFKNYKDLGV